MGLQARLPAGALAIGFLTSFATLPAVAPQPTVAATRPAAIAPALQNTLPQRPADDRFGFSGRMVQGGVMLGIAPRRTTLLTFNGMSVPVAPDDRFVIAFDRDAPMGATLVATLDNGRRITHSLTVAPRAWDISRLNSLPRIPVPQPEYDARRPAELAQINAARAMQTDARGWRQAFLWPVTGRISTLFGSQRIYKNGEAGSYHSGVDVARPTGTTVLAPADGVVILATAKPFTLEGYLLMVDHGGGLNSAFMHLSRIDVSVGAHVKRGQPIGRVGATGRATGPHLHWGMKWRDARIDPLLLAGSMPVAD